MPLPHYGPAKRRELVFFDLRHGLPTTWRVLRQRLSFRTTLRVIRRVILWNGRDPLADVPNPGWPAEKEELVRHQLSGAIHLDDALMREDLEEEERIDLLHDVISETGARFIQFALPLPAVDDWVEASARERLRFLREATARFFNGAMEGFIAEDHRIGFDVSACRFAQLARTIERPYLGTMFCAADSVFFSRQESPVRLERSGTIAGGATHCDFRFHYRGSNSTPASGTVGEPDN